MSTRVLFQMRFCSAFETLLSIAFKLGIVIRKKACQDKDIGHVLRRRATPLQPDRAVGLSPDNASCRSLSPRDQSGAREPRIASRVLKSPGYLSFLKRLEDAKTHFVQPLSDAPSREVPVLDVLHAPLYNVYGRIDGRRSYQTARLRDLTTGLLNGAMRSQQAGRQEQLVSCDVLQDKSSLPVHFYFSLVQFLNNSFTGPRFPNVRTQKACTRSAIVPFDTGPAWLYFCRPPGQNSPCI